MKLLRASATLAVVSLGGLTIGCGGGSSSTAKTTGSVTTAGGATTAATTGTTTASTTTTGTKTGATTPAQSSLPTAQAVKSDHKVTDADLKLIAGAINRISVECVARKKSKSTAVGRPTAGFRSQIDLLIAEFKDTPTTQFQLPKAKKSTTMHTALLRLGQALAVKAPKGCGANSNAGGGTLLISKNIRRALASQRGPKSTKSAAGKP